MSVTFANGHDFLKELGAVDLFTDTAAILNNLNLQNIMGFPGGKIS